MPIYNLNNKKYNIPDEVVADFEKGYPDATIAYSAEGKIYDIPVAKKNAFLKRYPNASLYNENQQVEHQEPIANNVMSEGIGTQEDADSLFKLNSALFKESDPYKKAALEMEFKELNDRVKEREAEQFRNELEANGEIQRLENIKEKAQLDIDKASFFDRFFNPDTRAAVAARDKAEEALETYQEANRNDDNWVEKNVGGVLRGIFDKVGDLRTWDFGASGVASAVALKDAVDKLENGEELTSAEQNMIDAFGLSAAVQSAYQDKVGTAYNVGGSLPESASFMASLALNPAGGVGRKIAEKAAKSAVKKYGTTLVGKLAKGAARVGGDIVEMGVATAVPGAGRVAEDYYNRLNGQSTFDVDDNGLIRYGGQVEQEEADDAIWKAFGSQFIENYSEAMGNYFAPMGNILSNLTSKGLKAAHLGKVAEAISDISSSQWSKGIQRFKDAVKFDGLVGEYMEEVAGNVMNAATVGDMNFNSPDDPRSVFNPDTNIETFLSCALMSGTMYAVEAPITLYNKYIPKRNLRNADNAASELLGNRWEDLRNQIDEADLGHMAQILTGVENATDLSLEQKQAIKNYASKLVQYQAYNSRKVQDAQEATPEANEAENAYNEGTENTTHDYVFAANRAKIKAENALKQADESVYNALNEAMATGQPVETFLNSLNGDVATLARDYYNKELRVRGTLDAVKDKAEEEIARETKIIKSVSDPKTGIYAEVSRIDHDEQGNEVLVPGYITGWIGEGESRTPVFLEEGAENTQENRKPLKPSQYKAETIEEMPMDEVISVMTSMIRDNAAIQAEQEAKYAPEVLNAQMQQGVPFEDETAVYVPFQVAPEGNAWQVEIYNKDENGKQSEKPTRTDVITNDQFRDILQAQFEANEAAQQQSVQEVVPTIEEETTNTPVETEEVAQTEEVQPEVVEEVQQPQQQAPVIPTKEDGSIDFVSYGKDNTFKTLGEKYGEKMPNKVAVTAKALAEDLVKAQEKLAKAEEAYDNAPIGREQKAEQARDKAKAELESIQREAEFWSSLDNEIKEAQAKRDALLNPKADIDMSEEPMNADEFIAQQLANGNIALESVSYKKETGYGEKERQKFIKMFRKAENGGMSIESAGDLLMQMDRENGTNFFNQNDANAGRDALINFLGSVSSWGDVTGYIRNNREAQAAKETEGLRNEIEEAIEANYHMTPEEYATLQEMEATENPFEGVDIEAKDAIFAEAALEFEEYLKSLENGQGTTEEVIEGNGDVLSEEQSDNTGGTEQRQGEGLDVSEGTVQSDDATQEESAEVEEGNTPFRQSESILEQAERIANEEARRKPLRQRAKEWEQKLGVKVNIIENFDDVTNKDAKRAIRNGQRVTGWYEESTGEVCLYMPYLESAQEIDATYIHEVVAHKGLRGLLGDKFDEFLDDVWMSMSEADKLIYLTYPGVNGNKRAAADEYIAHLAENIDVTESAWGKLAELIKKFLKAIGLESKMTHADIANTIKLSYQRLLSGEGGVDVVGDGTRFSAKKGSVTVSAEEYAKIAHQIATYPQKADLGHVFTDNNYYLCTDIDDEGNFRIVASLKIEGNEELINSLRGKDGQRNFKAIEGTESLASIVEEVKRRGGRTNWNIPTSKRQSRTNGQNDSVHLGKQSKSGTDQQSSDSDDRKPKFRVLTDKNGKKTLVGLHNISENKLRKALKQGGLANPSVAVIDMDKQSHTEYGDITLVLPASMIDKKTGKNVGTFMADAYTPAYPTVVKKMSDKGAKVLTKALESVDETFRSKVRIYFNSYLDSGTIYDALAYWYLSDTGKNPPILEAALPDGFTREEVEKVKSVNPEADSFYQLSEEEKQKALGLYADKFYGGMKEYENHLSDYTKRMQEVVKDESKPQMVRKNIQENLNSIERYGYEYDRVANYFKRAIFIADRQSQPSEMETFRNAFEEVTKNGLEEDFGNWLIAKEEELGVEEKLFAGYDNQGRAKYLPNTLENASKLMKKEGRAGATGLGGFNYFVAILAPVAKTTKQISAKKGNLSTQEEYDKFVEEWKDYYHDLAQQLQPGAGKWDDYGYHRLHEIAPMENPKAYVKKEYGIELSDEFLKDLNDVKNAIKNDFPARYFETKFERPVYLNEVAAAVIPSDMSLDLYGQLQRMGIPIYEYERGNNEARMAVVDKVTIDNEGIRFRIANQNQEIFVSNAQKAVEGIKQEKATPQQWLAMIEKNGGLKAGEDKWLGLSDWLKDSDAKTITKSEILDFINQNKIQIEEVHYEEEADMISKDEVSYSDEFQSLIDSLTEYDDEDQPYINKQLFDELKHEDIDFYNGFSIDYWGESIDIDDTESAARYLGLWGDRVNAINDTRLNYTTEGLENKSEIALVVPTIEPYNESDEIHFGDAGEGRAIAWIRFGETTTPNVAFINAKDAVNNYIAEMREKYNVRGGGVYDVMNEEEIKHLQELTSTEFDTRNKVERVLVIDEIQSKRHQEGRERGYKNPRVDEIRKLITKTEKEINKIVPPAYSIYKDNKKIGLNGAVKKHEEMVAGLSNELREKYQKLRNRMYELNDEFSKLIREKQGDVPVAPFEKNWHELAFKRMLRYAAENGFDKVAWTTGEQQAERYNIGNSVDRIERDRDGILIRAYNSDISIDFNEDGVVTSGEYKGQSISDILGKEMALKVMSLKEGESIEGDGLRIGGEGMKGFYDKMLPSFVNKYVKKWGTKVQDIELPKLEEAGRIMHSVDVTDAMKESVMEGQTMFRIAPQEEVQAEVDKFTSKYNGKEVVVLNSTVLDEELESLGLDVEDVREAIEKETEGFYDPITDKIYIFADIADADELEKTLFHENGHGIFRKNKKFVNEFNENSKDKFKKGREDIAKYYKEHERAEELFVRIFDQELTSGNFEYLPKYLSEELWNEFNDILKDFGYDRQEESDRRRKGSVVRTETDRGSEKETDVRNSDIEPNQREERKEKGRSKEQAERLKKLFDDVADMGLRGVLGNTNYDLAMLDIFYALPEKERTDVAVRAVKIGGDVAVAVDEYLSSLEEPTLWEKVVASITNALRKVGIDVQLTENDVKYLLWRSRKPLDRNSILDMAEDIDMKRKLNVGKFDNDPTDGGDTPGGGTRFRVANKLQIRDEYESTIKKGGYQAREAVQDAMLSLRRTQELIEKASGKKLRGFENAWEHENRLSSVVQAEIHEMERKFYKPMMDAVKKLAEAMGDKNDYAVADYLMLKHGIERNREMAVRKALTDTEGKIDRTQLEQWYKDKDAIRNDANLPTWREKQEAMDNAALNYGADMSVDYSGLTSMFGSDDLADCTDKAYKEVESIEKKYPSETKALGKAVKALNQSTIDKSFESGLLDRKVRDELKNDMYDYYVPLRGFDEVTSDEVYSYLDNDRNAFNAPLRRAKGRTSKADNPIAYMKSIAESGIMQGERNKMKQSFLNMVTNHPSNLVSVREGVWVVLNPATGEWEAASMPTIPNNATPADVESILEAWEASMEQQAATNPNIKKVSEGADVPYRVIGNRMEQHQVIIKRNGKSYTLTVNGNPRLAMALNGLTNPNNTSKDGRVAADIQKAVDKMNRTLAAWYTTRNPDFVASNFMRDTFYTNTIVRAKEGNKYANKFHKHYAELLMPGKMLSLFNKYENGKLDMNNKTEKAFYDFIMNGGETGYSNLKDIEHIKNEIANQLKGDRLKWFRQVSDKLDLVNRAVENTSRFAAFLTSREMGRDMSKSIFDAKEISVNFNKKGAGGTFYKGTGQTKFGNLAAMVGAGGRGLYVFFNAAIQGSTNLLHVMKVNPKGTSAGLAAMFLMGAVLPYLLSGDDDKDYYDLPDHVRRNHLVLPGAGDTWVSIPLPIEYRIMYGMGELFTSWRTGHERGSNVALKALSLTGQALPLNFLEEGLDAFVPSALSPLWQAYNNRSWTGLPIYKDNEFNKDDPEYTKAYKNVDRLIYNFTKSLYDWTFDEESQEEGIDLNPAVIESLARGYFGGLFTQMSNIVKTAETIGGEREFDWRNIPIGNRIFKSGDERTKEKRITNEYFDNMEKLDFLESRRRMLNRTIDGKAVPEEDVEKAKADLEQMIQTGVYQKYMKFKEYKKVADKIRKAMKDNGSTEELQRKLSEAQEKANEVLR